MTMDASETDGATVNTYGVLDVILLTGGVGFLVSGICVARCHI